ncbi:MAG: endonuclease/exonuclease/phosphatase family protein [Chloroflexota bacterium]
MRESWLRTLEATLLLLVFLQAMRALFSTLFGVIYDAVFAGPFTPWVMVIGALVLLAFLAPLVVPRHADRLRPALLAAVAVTAVARVPMTINSHPVRLYSSIVVVAAGGFYLAALLRHTPAQFSRAVVLALVADQLLRALGHTWDLALRHEWLVPQAIISAGLILLARYLAGPETASYELEAAGGAQLGLSPMQFGGLPPVQPGGLPPMQLGGLPPVQLGGLPPMQFGGLPGGLAWAGFLFVQTTLLALPNALSRWSGIAYSALAPLLLGVTLLAILPGLRESITRSLGNDPIHARLWGLALALVTLIGLTVGRRVPGLAGAAGLLAAQLALLLALPHLLAPRTSGAPERTGLWLAVGGLAFLTLNFAYAFAFTYPYTLAAFKGMGLPVLLIGAGLAVLPALLRPISADGAFTATGSRLVWAAATLALVILVAGVARPHRVEGMPADDTIRIGTYNIHYGYDTDWHYTLEAQARTIQASGADVIALQEVDTGRLTSFAVDDALWLGRRLGMHVVYLPTVEQLTGIALLSRHPIEAAETRLLTSQLEPTGIVRARLRVGERTLDAYAVWMGLTPEERAVQLTDALAFVAQANADTPAIWGGDFNSTPDSPVHARIAETGFIDPFVALGLEPGFTDPADNPRKRIDFVWLRHLTPLNGEVMDSLASDHLMVVVEARLPH